MLLALLYDGGASGAIHCATESQDHAPVIREMSILPGLPMEKSKKSKSKSKKAPVVISGAPSFILFF